MLTGYTESVYCNHQPTGQMKMSKTKIKAWRWTGETRFFDTMAEALRFADREANMSRLWAIEEA